MESPKGRLIRSTTAETEVGVVVPTVTHRKWLPMAEKIEKGMRNFTDAATHNRWRTAAEFCFKARVDSHTAAANRLDCHRWFASGAR
jgi:hypothetical protein